MVHDAAGAAWNGSLDTFRLLANSVPAMIAYYDSPELGYGCRFANKAYASAFGLTEASIIGRTFAQVIGEAAAREVQPSIDAVVNESRAVSYVRELTAADGSRRWIEVNVLPNLGPDGRPVGAFVIVTDITKHQLATQALRESEERLDKFMQASAEGIAFHRDGIVADANPPLIQMLGYTLDELRGRHVLDFIAPDQRARVQAVLARGQELSYESAIIRKDGTHMPVELIGRTLAYGDERLRMTVVRDLRDRHAAQARIHHLAHHDALTGLPNRMSFMERLGQQIELARVSGKPLALLFVDL
ncbi:MAG: PAS domain S-box protein, partial [Betaproteobacteria bacterium]